MSIRWDLGRVCLLRFWSVVAVGIQCLILTYFMEERGRVFTAALAFVQMFVAGTDLFVFHGPSTWKVGQPLISLPELEV